MSSVSYLAGACSLQANVVRDCPHSHAFSQSSTAYSKHTLKPSYDMHGCSRLMSVLILNLFCLMSKYALIPDAVLLQGSGFALHPNSHSRTFPLAALLLLSLPGPSAPACLQACRNHICAHRIYCFLSHDHKQNTSLQHPCHPPNGMICKSMSN